jgi:DNA-binding beta-propeller fold protein YncE
VWGEPGAGDGQFNFEAEGMLGGYPQGAITFDASGNIYVADTGNSRIQKFGPDRRFLLAWGSAGTGDGQFLGAADVVVDRNGRVYVVDGNRGGDPDNPTSTRVNSVQVFDDQGAFIASWGAPGNEPGQLSSPTGLAIDVDGNILVTDIDNSRLQRFSPEGAYLDGWGGFGVGQREFSLPIDVAVDPIGRIYVVDWSSNDVKVFDNDGRFLDQWSGTKYRDGQLNGPSGIAVDGQGGIYVTDNSGRLQKYQLG